MAKSPYLSTDTRLADVLAALQATATYKFYQLPIEGSKGWAYRITGSQHRDKEIAVRKVFEDHPEFFRIDDGGKGALVWRRQHQRLYDVDRQVEITRAEFEALTPERQSRISRTPLEPSELATLIGAAVELHTRALAQRESRRWWIIPLVSLVSAFSGALVGAVFSI